MAVKQISPSQTFTCHGCHGLLYRRYWQVTRAGADTSPTAKTKHLLFKRIGVFHATSTLCYGELPMNSMLVLEFFTVKWTNMMQRTTKNVPNKLSNQWEGPLNTLKVSVHDVFILGYMLYWKKTIHV